MTLSAAWATCNENQFIVRKSAKDWGIAKTHYFTETLMASATFGFDFTYANDWIVVDHRPPILANPDFHPISFSRGIRQQYGTEY